MKILHVILSIDPQAGGPSYVLPNEIRELCRAGHDVTLLAADRQYGKVPLPREEFVRSVRENPDFAGAEVHVGHIYGRRRPWNNFAYSPECARWLRRRLSDPKKKPDVVHINATYSHMLSVAAACARKAIEESSYQHRAAIAILISEQPYLLGHHRELKLPKRAGSLTALSRISQVVGDKWS